MSEILLKAEDARATATDVKTSATDTQSDFDSLKTKLSGLTDSFRGESQKAFEEKYDEWHTSAKGLLEALEGLGDFLNAAADTIEQTDQDIAGQLKQ